MLDYIVYGKIIIDAIKLLDGRIVRDVLGGGGPQGAFGARLWSDSVGFLSCSGTDMPQGSIEMLKGIDVDLHGWVQFPDLPTTRGAMVYDENEYLTSKEELQIVFERLVHNIKEFISRPIPLPSTYRRPRVIHLITEYTKEEMVQSALELRRDGSLFSLEPLIDFRQWSNIEAIIDLLQHVDIVTPDWPSASGIAGSDKPKEVLSYWSKLGPQMVAVRHGHYGSYAWDRSHDEYWHIPPAPVDVIDPTGAGNAYGGGLCVGWDKSHDARTAACYGAVSAAFLVRMVGVPEMTPDLQSEAQKMLALALKLPRSL